MLLRIISPSGEKKFDIDWIEVDTPVGNFVIHTGHAPTVLTLLPNHDVVFQFKKGHKESITISRGIIEITREAATIIVSE